jgi:geranylgeranyl pyrophosphate synthase
MQGKITLPTLYYLEQNPLNQAEIKLIQNKDQKFLKQLQDNIIASGVLEKTKDIIKDYNSKFTSELKTKFPKANDLAILCAQTLTTIL